MVLITTSAYLSPGRRGCFKLSQGGPRRWSQALWNQTVLGRADAPGQVTCSFPWPCLCSLGFLGLDLQKVLAKAVYPPRMVCSGERGDQDCGCSSGFTSHSVLEEKIKKPKLNCLFPLEGSSWGAYRVCVGA